MKPITHHTLVQLSSALIILTVLVLAAPQAAAQAGPYLAATATPAASATATAVKTAVVTGTPASTAVSITPQTIGEAKPGVYDTGSCVTFEPFHHGDNITATLCVINVEKLKDGKIMVAVSWTIAGVKPNMQVIKLSYFESPNIILRDNFGARYPQINAGQGAYKETILENGVPVIGWFSFPEPNAKATSLSLSLDYGLRINDLKLEKFLFSRNEMQLDWYDQRLIYPSNQWAESKTDAGGAMIELNLIPGCTIEEWPAGDFEGKYKNSMDIGNVTYEIHGWLEDTYGVREYLAQKIGYVKIPVENQAFLRTRIPLSNSATCIAKISEILATLDD